MKGNSAAVKNSAGWLGNEKYVTGNNFQIRPADVSCNIIIPIINLTFARKFVNPHYLFAGKQKTLGT